MAKGGKKDKMEIRIVSFTANATVYKFKEPLVLKPEDLGDGKLCLSDDDLSIAATGSSWTECMDGIYEELEMLWEDYALASDAELTKDAITLKEKLLEMVEKE